MATLEIEEVYATSPDRSGRSSDEPLTAIFLHGLLGASKNWRTFTKTLATDAAGQLHRDVRVLLADLRCHGASTRMTSLHPPHDMAAAATDVLHLAHARLGGSAPHVLCGLSLGGKVALVALQQMMKQQQQQQQQQTVGSGDEGARVHGLPQQVWVLDSQPGTVPLDADAPTSVGKIIALISHIPTPLASRQALYDLLSPQGIPQPVALWLGSNLQPLNGDPSKLVWTFDLQGAAALYHSYRLTSCWDVFKAPPPGTTIHFVRGERSDRWTPGMMRQLEDATAAWRAVQQGSSGAVGDLRMHVLPKAGHWLQADNPKGLTDMMLQWLRQLQQQ